MTVYDALGGLPFFEELVERFYRRVGTDLLLRPLYPDDLTEPKRHLALFLAQYWGGPTTYSRLLHHRRRRHGQRPLAAAASSWRPTLLEHEHHRRRSLFQLASHSVQQGRPELGGCSH